MAETSASPTPLVLDFDQIRARIEEEYAAAAPAVQGLHDGQVTCRWGDIATLFKQANDMAGIVAALAALDPGRPYGVWDHEHNLCRVCGTWFPMGRCQFDQPGNHVAWCPWAQSMGLYPQPAVPPAATPKQG